VVPGKETEVILKLLLKGLILSDQVCLTDAYKCEAGSLHMMMQLGLPIAIILASFREICQYTTHSISGMFDLDEIRLRSNSSSISSTPFDALVA
jgi:hypothetical protein